VSWAHWIDEEEGRLLVKCEGGDRILDSRQGGLGNAAGCGCGVGPTCFKQLGEDIRAVNGGLSESRCNDISFLMINTANSISPFSKHDSVMELEDSPRSGKVFQAGG
jgi:hypothetical protein